MKIVSLGAGVQSTTLVLLAHHGEIDPPDFAVFSDTGWEPKAVYKHLDWLEKYLSFPVVRVAKGNLRDELLNENSNVFTPIPFFTENRGIGRRQCTNEFKLRPIQKFCKPHSSKGNPVICEIGISTDEWARIKPSRVKYIQNTWPLIDLRMSRKDCKDWLKNKGYIVPPKSSCLGCPYHSNESWREIKNNYPEEFEETCKIDEKIRTMPKFKIKQYMHQTLKPLRAVDFRNAEERGQLNFFIEECEGMCGV
tara:strand:+ start:755 stop:1507 length:753 start_codon:yes stop_codon:yes gene_type:complete